MTDYTTTVRTYNNIPFEYRLKKDGYYDIVGTTVGGTNVTGLIFWAFNGLNMTYEQLSGSPMVVKANDGQLPDLTHISGVTGCLKEAGQQYPAKIQGTNYTLIGSPTISSDNVVSDFSASNGLKLPSSLPSTITSLDIIFKGNLTNVSSNSVIFAHANTSERYIGIRNTGKFSMYTSSWVEGTTALSTGTEYWFRVVKDGNNYKGYTLVDNSYTLDTLPDLSSWTQEFSTSTNIFSGLLFNVGYNYKTTAEYFKGSIDLKGCSVNINGSEFWNPLLIDTTVDGLLPSGVTDDGSAQTWNLFYNGDYRLNTTSTMTGYTWVGSVAIPAHTI